VGVVDALAEVLVGGIVRESLKLLLHGGRQSRVLDDRVLGILVREVGVEISHVKYGFLEGQLEVITKIIIIMGYSPHLA